ncbi:hypothetical protein J4Q44_G00052500 [Coregonus suidteri]|uniref:Uncharacterized protein n=1 Tax=Coregonus suidteri TaxID=861788 RepID=A0AAN8R6I7_9TELE
MMLYSLNLLQRNKCMQHLFTKNETCIPVLCIFLCHVILFSRSFLKVECGEIVSEICRLIYRA